MIQDKPALHASSGITRRLQPKPSFNALAHLQSALGAYRYHRMVTNAPGTLRVHEYQHGQDDRKTAWVAWSPTGEDRRASVHLPSPPGG